MTFSTYASLTLLWFPVSEIAKIRGSLFQISGNAKPEALPEPQGTVVTLTEKVYVPVREHPDVSILSCTLAYLFVILRPSFISFFFIGAWLFSLEGTI